LLPPPVKILFHSHLLGFGFNFLVADFTCFSFDRAKL